VEKEAAVLKKFEDRIDLLKKYEPTPTVPAEVTLSMADAEEMAIEK